MTGLSRTMSGIDWLAIFNDLMGAFMTILGVALIVMVASGFTLALVIGVRKAIQAFKDGEI